MTNRVLTGVAPLRTILSVTTPARSSAAITRSPAASRPRPQRMPVFSPSLAAAMDWLTASPPTFREPDAARYPDAETGIVTFNVEGVFPQDAGSYLSSRGIALRSGQHCAKILPDFLKVPGTVRASLYFYNTKEECDTLIEALKTCTVENAVDIFI